MRRPLIVTDQGLNTLGFIDELQSILARSQIASSVFKDVIADPPENVVLDALALAVSEGADGVIGIGGGSSMDCAKIIAVLLQSQKSDAGQSLNDIYGVNKVKGSRSPLILIPTTAGTGSEVTPIAIVTTGSSTKAGIVSQKLIPDIALLDASLSLDLPPHITAATGIDAMVHAIEAYTGKLKKNPYSDLLAKEALVLLTNNIERACLHGKNVAARQSMLLGACYAGQAFANSPVGAVHALAYPLGGHFHIPHGLSNALMLPHVIRFNNTHACDLYAQLAAYVLPDFSVHTSPVKQAEKLADYFVTLSKNLKLPTRLRTLDITEDHLSMLANDAMLQTRLLVNNPREVLYEDALRMYQQAY